MLIPSCIEKAAPDQPGYSMRNSFFSISSRPFDFTMTSNLKTIVANTYFSTLDPRYLLESHIFRRITLN